MLTKSGIGVVGLMLASMNSAQEPAKPPLDSAQRAAIASQTSQSVSGDRAASPTEKDAFNKACETAPCRRDLTIHLLKKDGTYFDQKPALLPPMIQGGFVTLYPGDKVRLVPIFDTGKFKEWQLASDQMSDTTVVTIEFSQMDGKPGMTAMISKTSGPALKLSLGMLVIDGPDHPVKTSSCALRAGKWFDSESWPFPIYSLLIGPPKQLADNDPMNCE